MYTEQSKKLTVVSVLEVLKKYSDADHRLSQKEIGELLEREYGVKLGRKALRRNLMNLLEFGYQLEYTEKTRMKKDGTPETVATDWYLVRDFTDSELRLLIDGLLFSQHIPYSQCRDLVEKLENLSNVYFRSRVAHIVRLPDQKSDNKQLFLNIELLDEAIERERKVKFSYAEYTTDKELQLRKNADGTDREYIISPYQMAAKEGKYYLICNYDKYEDISNYRIDRIRDLEILENEPAKSFDLLRGSNGRRLDLSQYMREHIYMYSDDTVRAEFRIIREMVSDVLDMFGPQVKFREKTEKTVVVSASVNRLAMLQFAQNFAPDVVLLSPPEMVTELKERLEKAVRAYQ